MLGSPAEPEVPALPPGSPYSVEGNLATSVSMSAPAAFLFLDVGELKEGESIAAGFSGSSVREVVARGGS